MELKAGERLGPFEVIAPVGAGGMGQVYRALDTRLQRTVAIKVLSPELSADPGFRQRFEREARAISSLQHPNICALYDIGEHDGNVYLVLEFVEGETLAHRLERPLPLDQLLRCAAEIAEALDAAHRRGIVHRDLKPANIMLTRGGAKLLDFGVAKLDSDSAIQDSDQTRTMDAGRLTEAGTLIGTIDYMSPEQLEGRPADARSDIFALGAVIYEMAAGKRAFPGKSAASVIAAIISTEPAPLAGLRPDLPAALERLVKRCIAKDPDRRWQSAADLASELRWIADSGARPDALPAPAAPPSRRREFIAWSLAGLCLLLAVAYIFLFPRAHSGDVSLTASLLPPPGAHYDFAGDEGGPPVISPDGALLAFAATNEQGKRQLWIRDLADSSVKLLPGTDDGFFPFWSPDSRNLAFFSAGKLRRIAIAGGTSKIICDAPAGRGGSWGGGDTIVFTPDSQAPIFVVNAEAGAPRPVTRLDDPHYTTHRWPSILPDGQHLLYFASNHAAPHRDTEGIFFASLDGRERRFVTSSNSQALAVQGHLLFIQGSTLLAQPFDPASGKLSSQPVPLADNVRYDEGTWHAVFDASPTGRLLYQSASGGSGSRPLWYGRDGKTVAELTPPDSYQNVSLSPDDRKLAVIIGSAAGALWTYALDSNQRVRLSFQTAGDRSPVWSPDGKRIAFSRTQGRARAIFVTSAEVAASAESLLPCSDQLCTVTDWSRDGKYLLYSEDSAGAIYAFSLADRQTRQIIPGQNAAHHAQFSPDGRWITYVSEESGRPEVYVTRFPEATGRWQISEAGGALPRWRRDSAIVFWSLDQTIAEAAVNTKDSNFQVLNLRPLFKSQVSGFPNSGFGFEYDVTSSGDRFLIIAPAVAQDQPLTLVINWLQHLARP